MIRSIFINNKKWDEWTETVCDSAGSGAGTHWSMVAMTGDKRVLFDLPLISFDELM